MNLREAAEMALERLESHEYWMDDEAIKALRQALAQPEQEPVAWIVHEDGVRGLHWSHPRNGMLKVEPLYTAPPKRWVGLTDEEIKEGADLSRLYRDQFEPVARWAESKLKEKNHGAI